MQNRALDFACRYPGLIPLGIGAGFGLVAGAFLPMMGAIVGGLVALAAVAVIAVYDTQD